jgi:hypothetical protein
VSSSDDSAYPDRPLKRKEAKATAEEIAARQDALLRIPRDTNEAGLSSLAWIAAHQAEVAEKFFAWWEPHRLGGERWQEALPRFEQDYFEGELYPSARGILGFAIARKIVPDPRIKRSLEPPKRPILTPAERLRKFDEAVGRKVREMSMEDREADERRREEQIAKLQRQLREVGEAS